eukprot:7505031-Alexandrium_andersonii.AAC.1
MSAASSSSAAAGVHAHAAEVRAAAGDGRERPALGRNANVISAVRLPSEINRQSVQRAVSS